MPRPPRRAEAVEKIPGAVFAPADEQTGAFEPLVVPLNLGDTWLPPLTGARMEDLHEREYPDLHRYADPRGTAPLIDALVEKVRSRNGLACERESVLVTAGATGALAAAVGTLADPADEVLILSPFWPLIRGIVHTFRARPVEVPFYDRVESVAEAVAAVRARLGPRSVALYVSTPSNPTGRVIPGAWLEALAQLARRENLWLLSDEVYEDYVYRGEQVSLARFAPERTLSVFSFSKAYGMAGHRVGYLVGPPPVLAAAEKVVTHTFYAAPTGSQMAALRALEGGDAWIEKAKRLYQEAGDDAAAALGLPPPGGSTFLFLDVRAWLDTRGIDGFLEDCMVQGVALARGGSSGENYTGFVRLCYTAAPPDRVSAAVRRVARLLDGTDGLRTAREG
jgi:aspartate/methionine/tyrosine aminotransferase